MAAIMTELAEADITDGTGGSNGRDDDSSIVAGTLVRK
jgi:hypothetical protein